MKNKSSESDAERNHIDELISQNYELKNLISKVNGLLLDKLKCVLKNVYAFIGKFFSSKSHDNIRKTKKRK